MASTHSPGTSVPPGIARSRRPWYLTLPAMILYGLIIGGIFGYVFESERVRLPSGKIEVIEKGLGSHVSFLRDIFINLIKLVIGPLVFATIVSGIAAESDLKKVGRMGWKAAVYFFVITTIALVLGAVAANVAQPGAGLHLQGDGDTTRDSAAPPRTWQQMVVQVFPASLADAWARNDVLQIVTFSVIFGVAVVTVGKAARPIVVWCDALTQVMFRFTSIIMLFAPIGVAAAMSQAIADNGLEVLKGLAWLVGSLYATLAIFVVVVFGIVMLLFRIPLGPFLRAIREPFTVAFATTSSESALPKLLENMQRLGAAKRIVSFVIPTGYTFNLTGSTLYLGMATIFIAQAADRELTIAEQVSILFSLMLTSKGIAGVPRASFVILLGTASSFNLPLAALSLIFSVDKFMDMARTGVNVIGNGIAGCAIARSEGEFDDEKARVFGTPAEVPLEIAEGEPAAAIDAAKGS